MGMREFLERALHKNQRFKEIKEEDKLQRTLEERKKSSNERELERYLEEEREKSIKKNLEEFRKHRQKEFWEGNSVLKGKNQFAGNKNLFKDKKRLFKMECDNMSQGGMFWK